MEKRTNPYSSSPDENSLSEQTSAGESSSEEENKPKNPRKRTFSDRQLEQLVSGFDSSSEDSDNEAIHCVGKCYINLFMTNLFGYVIMMRLPCFQCEMLTQLFVFLQAYGKYYLHF